MVLSLVGLKVEVFRLMRRWKILVAGSHLPRKLIYPHQRKSDPAGLHLSSEEASNSNSHQPVI